MATSLRNRPLQAVALTALLASMLVTLPARAAGQGAPASPTGRWEGNAGFGAAWPIDGSVFDLPDDGGARIGADGFLAARYNLDERWALGVRIALLLARTRDSYPSPDFLLQPGVSRFDLVLQQVDLEARHTFSRGRWQPYAFACAGLVGASADIDFESVLDARGADFGGGAGVCFVPRAGSTFGLEGQFMSGFSRWERLPYSKSSGRQFNPGFAALHLVAATRWGTLR